MKHSIAAAKRSIVAALVLVASAGCQEAEAPKTALPPPAQPSKQAPQRAPAVVSYAEVVERARPGVVTIRAARRVRAPRQHPFLNNPLLREFFDGMFGGAQAQQSPMQMALGSGVIVHSSGTILTSHHVIDGAEQIKVELSNHSIFDATVVGKDAPSDLAVL